MVKSQIGGRIAGQIAAKFGVNEQTAQSGIDVILSTILGGLVSKVSSPGGAETLGKTIDEGGYNGGMLDNLSEMFSGSGADDLAKKGGGIVSMIFGDKAAVLGPVLAKLTGMKSDSLMSMLAMLAPLVMGFLGKTKNASGLDARGLASMLMSQKDSIAAAMPAGVSDAMGLGLHSTNKPAASTARAPQIQAAGGGGMAKVLIPLAILAAVGFGCYKYIFGGMRPSGPEGNIIVPMDPNAPAESGFESSGGRGATEPTRPPAEASAEPAEAPAAETTEPAAEPAAAPAAETTEPAAEAAAIQPST